LLDRALELVIENARVPRLTSHGLRHTAATHMVRGAHDVGELRAVADLLGHSPDMLMKVYAHALPEGRRAIADCIGARSAGAGARRSNPNQKCRASPARDVRCPQCGGQGLALASCPLRNATDAKQLSPNMVFKHRQ
jgi:hypothetical protein